MRENQSSRECHCMVWIRDDNGGKFICYAEDLNSETHATENEKEHGLDTRLVLAPNCW